MYLCFFISQDKSRCIESKQISLFLTISRIRIDNLSQRETSARNSSRNLPYHGNISRESTPPRTWINLIKNLLNNLDKQKNWRLDLAGFCRNFFLIIFLRTASRGNLNLSLFYFQTNFIKRSIYSLAKNHSFHSNNS